MIRWLARASKQIRNASYQGGDDGPAVLLEVKYLAVAPFWVLLEPEEPQYGGVFLFTYSVEEFESTGATWYPDEESAKRAAAFEFGFGEEDPWVLLPPDAGDPKEFAAYYERR